MKKLKTDNSYLYGKIALRKNAIEQLKKIKVLDCFGGKGIIWEKIKSINKKQCIEVISIEIEKGKNKKAIEGNNLKLLPSLDLKEFNVIDVDAYGSPFKQLDIILNNRTLKQGTIIFVTDIQTMQGAVPHKLLLQDNITRKMIKKIPSLFYKKSFEIMKSYLNKKGITKIDIYRPEKRKKYYTFTI